MGTLQYRSLNPACNVCLHCYSQADNYVKQYGGSVLVLAVGPVNYPGAQGGSIKSVKPTDKTSVLKYSLGSSPEAEELQQYFPGEHLPAGFQKGKSYVYQ